MTVLCSRSCVAGVVGGEEHDSVVASGGEVDVGVGPGSVAVEGGVVEDRAWGECGAVPVVGGAELLNAYAYSADAGEVVGCDAFDVTEAGGDRGAIGW